MAILLFVKEEVNLPAVVMVLSLQYGFFFVVPLGGAAHSLSRGLYKGKLPGTCVLSKH